VCATRNFELDPASAWLEKAEFHCRRALELDSDLAEGHVASAFLLWGAMYQRGRPFHPRKAVSHSIVQVYVWNLEYDLAREEIQAWRAENPGNKYPVYYAPQLAMMTGDWKEARILLDEAVQLLPEEPLIVSLQGVFYATTGKGGKVLDCLTQACASPKSFGHAHHSYYQFACILALLERREAAFEWLERSVGNGFACWPFFLKDP